MPDGAGREGFFGMTGDAVPYQSSATTLRRSKNANAGVGVNRSGAGNARGEIRVVLDAGTDIGVEMPEGVGMTSEEETIARNADSARRLTAAQGLTISSLVDIVCTKDVSAVDRTVAEKNLVKALVI